jgi:HEAT repeat protein
MRFVAFFLGLSLALVAAPASAQLSFAEAQAAIDSTDAARIQSGIEAIGLSGEARGVPLIVARVRRGLTPELLESALDTLAVLGQPQAGPLLIELLSHRRASVRLRAVQALATCHPAGADHALAGALSDSSPDVRAAAATAIGDVGGTGAMDQLFLAFDRGVPEAGAAIGRLARPADITRMLGMLGHVPFTQMGPILADMLGRDGIPSRSRLEIVAALGELASADARGLLEQYVQAHPGTDAVTRAAEAAAARIAQ